LNRGNLPRLETIAMEVAVKNGYRLAYAHNLARVAQFEAFKDPDAFRATYLDVLKQSLCRTVGPTSAAMDSKALAKMNLTELVESVGWTSISALELPLESPISSRLPQTALAHPGGPALAVS
jgi:hypothetical protein